MSTSPSRTLLLVEDEPTLQRILGSVLSDAGHVVETVGTGEAALERLRARDDVDLVLSDKNLPGMSGLDLLAHMRDIERSQGRAVPFVLVTGYPSRESAATVLQSGGDGYLVKPFRSLAQAVADIDRVLSADLAPRRRATALARRIAEAIGGVASLDGVFVAVDIEEPDVRTRVSAALTRAGARVGDASHLPAGDVGVCATHTDRLLQPGADRADVSRVLCDVNAPFDDLVAVIARGGAALVDPTLVDPTPAGGG